MIAFSNSLRILGQQHDGRYVEVSRTTIPVDAYVESVSDLDGDGDPDVIVRESNGTRWRILLNAGDAHLSEFARVTSYRTTDLDVDGQAELMVVISGKLIVYRVDDKRQFQKISETSVRSGQFLDTVADLDGDGDLDILLRNPNDYSRVQIMLGSGDGSFHELASGTYPSFADWNADSNTDLLILNGSELKVLFGDSHGNFSAALVTTVVSPASLELSSDLDADGDPDVVLHGANDGIAHILINSGDGRFTELAVVNGYYFADWNGDGQPDLLSWSTTELTVRLWREGGAVRRCFPDAAVVLVRLLAEREGSGR